MTAMVGQQLEMMITIIFKLVLEMVKKQSDLGLFACMPTRCLGPPTRVAARTMEIGPIRNQNLFWLGKKFKDRLFIG